MSRTDDVCGWTWGCERLSVVRSGWYGDRVEGTYGWVSGCEAPTFCRVGDPDEEELSVLWKDSKIRKVRVFKEGV